MKKLLAVLLIVVTIVGAFAGCKSEPEDVLAIDYKAIKKQSLGSMMPELLFAEDGKIAFWGEFGLFIVNGEDGSIYRGKNLENIGYNKMGGDYVTTFTVSPDYKTVYFFNVDNAGNNLQEYYYRFDITEDTIKQAPLTHEVEVVDKPILAFDSFAGPEKEPGYTTNPMIYEDDVVVYLHSENWEVKDLEMVFYNHNTGEYRRFTIFE